MVSEYGPSEGTDTGIFTQMDACHIHLSPEGCRIAGCYEDEFYDDDYYPDEEFL